MKSDDEYKSDREHFIAFWVTGFGILSSCIGILLARTSHNPNPNELQEVLLGVMRGGIFSSSILSCGILFDFDSEHNYGLSKI